ncbi:serine hydrolase domain-containing protein [Massilia sp. LjRoot122]|uniref:serine hydrolase domain-containing protein n=1 Tax=Massilia sp. LjRoot122 TaxID=3342257 RepID=UPI003ECC8263
MKKKYSFLTAAALLLAYSTACNADVLLPSTTPATSVEQQVDALFAKWNRTDVPGASVVVIRDGKVVLSKSYGMADLERGVPITSQTVFNVGSVAKQFTAFAIQLLVQDGKLALDDDMRKYLPELPDLKQTITIRHLLHHTSGMRDSSNLLSLAGWRYEDVAMPEDMLTMLKNQRKLNFAPGTEHLYSNGGYIVLAAIVERVSGQPLSKFAKERIFDPLGMKHTRFQTHISDLVPNRAQSYVLAPGGAYKNLPTNNISPGPGNLLTTAEDLALWDRNFDDGRIGGTQLQAKMLETGVLNSGAPVNYASGLYFETYRGLKLVEHLGTTAGYIAIMSRFPAQHFTVIALANARSVAPVRLSRQITDIFLAQDVAPQPAPAPPKQYPAEVKLDQAKLAAVAGFYALSPEFGCNFSAENEGLAIQCTGQGKAPLFASSDRAFFAKMVDAQFSFDAPGKAGVSERFVLHQNGKDQPGLRTRKPSLSDADMQAYEGKYYSDELRVLYSIERKNGKLVMIFPRGELPMDYAGGHKFFAPGPVGVAMFDCAVPTACSGFKVHGERVRELQFTKVALVAPSAPATAANAVLPKRRPASRAKAASR